VSDSVVVKEMQVVPEANNIEINLTTSWVYLKATLNNNGVAVSPKNPDGASLLSHIEKKIARIVRGLRSRKFHVLASEVLRWAAKEINGTEYAKYLFVGGEPT
jgi:hypothetical protein